MEHDAIMHGSGKWIVTSTSGLTPFTKFEWNNKVTNAFFFKDIPVEEKK